MNPLCRLSATEAVALLKKGEVSPLEMVDAAAARIAETDGVLNAMPTLCLERARDHARRLMQHGGGPQPPHSLHGLPIAVKDNVHVQGVRCTMGSPILADQVSAESDPCVQRLEANGAIVIGKSNIPEFAAGGNTFNEVFGVTRNPWNTARTPGGSSGGTAAALASGQVWLGTGNDFGGSIRLPSSFCSLVGLRPTAGRVPRIQKQPYSPLNVEGPMARSVADCALMLECEAGWHPLDPLSWPIQQGEYLAAVNDPQPPRGIAFSLDLGIYPTLDAEVARVCSEAARRMQAAGCAVAEAHPELADACDTFQVLRGAGYVANMGAFLAQHREQLKPEVIANAEYGLGLGAADIARAEIAQGEIVRRMARFLGQHEVLICPTAMTPAIPVEQRYLESLNGVRFDGYMGWLMSTCAISVTGCPVLALPCGFTRDGLPVGLQVIGAPRTEARLLQVGAWLEQVLAVGPCTPIDPRAPA
jgi:amidase